MIEKRSNKKGTYWYKFVYEECAVCGMGKEYKYRVYDRPKPEDPYDRHEYFQYACTYHFY